MDFIFDRSLVLYLPLNKLDGVSIRSQDAYGHQCSVTGALHQANGRYFDGVDDRINLGNNAVLYPARFTWEFWVNVQNTGANEAILGTPTGTRRPWEILAQGTDDSIHGAICQSDFTQVNTAFSDLIVEGAGWVHFVFTGDGAALRGYLNGVASSTTGSYDGTLDIANRESNILGVARTDIWYLNGLIGEVRLYNRALTPLEIENNYLATKWRYR